MHIIMIKEDVFISGKIGSAILDSQIYIVVDFRYYKIMMWPHLPLNYIIKVILYRHI